MVRCLYALAVLSYLQALLCLMLCYTYASVWAMPRQALSVSPTERALHQPSVEEVGKKVRMAAKRADAVALGKVIEARRSEMGYSRPEMAKVAGISYPYAYEIERGAKYPGAEALEKIAAALEVPAQELVAAMSERLANPTLGVEEAVQKPSRTRVARSEDLAFESAALAVTGASPAGSGTYRNQVVDRVTTHMLRKLEPVIRDAVAEALKDVL